MQEMTLNGYVLNGTLVVVLRFKKVCFEISILAFHLIALGCKRKDSLLTHLAHKGEGASNMKNEEERSWRCCLLNQKRRLVDDITDTLDHDIYFDLF